MSGKITIFQKLLEKFKFSSPVSPADQAFILSSMRDSLAAVLKTVKEYSFVYGLVLRIFFRARYMGVRLTVTQSFLVLGAASLVTAAAVAAGIAYAAVNLTGDGGPLHEGKRREKIEETAFREPARIPGEKEKAGEKKPEIAAVKIYRLGIEPFGNENIDRDKSSMVTERIRAGLAGHLGGGSIIQLSGGPRAKNFNLLLTGSVGKLGSIIMISAKVIDLEKGSALYITDENINSESEINMACDKISGRIAETIRKK